MKNLFAGFPHAKFIAAASAFIWTIALVTSARGVELRAARVTQVVNDVKVLLGKEAPRPVALGDLIRHGAPVSTGTQSRSELTFDDRTITRLGANTSFSFKEGTREMTLIDGAILFWVPKGSGGATIRTAGVTAAITGTTGIGEFHPASASNPHLFSKWLCLEGTFRLYLANGQSVELGPGQMVTTDGKSFSTVLTFDIARLVSTSLFFTGFDRPLPSLDLIVLEEQKQLFATPTPNPLDPIRTHDVIDQAMVAERTPTPPPQSPTPSKFGTLTVITSPVPYLITNGTVITTDPSITTNSVTDFGKIYRGLVDDGAFSLWAFGSTSAVDTALNFDTNFENAGHFPLAAFKFTSLVLAGNPTIDLTNGGVPNLALISVGDITSGLPGGTLTFTGLDALLLASQNGSINLGSEITFQDISTLFFYARGTNGDLTLASPIIGATDLFLYAGRNITFNAGTDLIAAGQFSIRSAGGNISVSESGNIAIGGSLLARSNVIADAANGGNITFATGGSFSASDVFVETTVKPGVTLTDGATITFEIGTGLTVNGGSLSLTINDSHGGTIGTGGNITLNTGANLTVNGGGALTLSVLNNDGGHIGTGGNIFVTTEGNLTAGSIDALIDNRNGGTIDSSANLTFNIGGALTTTGDASFGISNRNNDSGAGRIGADAGINVSAASISTGGALNTAIDNSSGGTIGGSANGGVIGSDAVINLTANNISTGGGFNALIDNSSGGMIGGSANLSVNLSGNLAAQGDALFKIDNSNGGMIGLHAGMNVSAARISAVGFFLAQIFNYADGNIVGSANIGFNLAGDLTAQNTAVLVISNFNGGTIGSDAAVTLSANNISSGVGVDATIANYLGGNIGGNATINVTAANISTDAFGAEIANYLGGNIGANATVNVTAANITANSLVADVNNINGGSIGSTANVTLNVGGDLATQNDAAFQILNFDNGSGSGPGTIGSNARVNVTANSISTGGTLLPTIMNFGGGTIGGNATINLTAANITTGAALNAAIDNSSAGTIGGSANLNFNLTGDLTTQGAANFLIDNHGGGTIGGNTAINVNAANITANSLLAQINNTSGNIGGNANINFNLTGDLQTVGDASFSILNGGGTIGGDSSVNLNAASISIGGSLSSTTDVTADAANGRNMAFATGGSFSASDVVVETTVEPGITLTNGANITFDIGTGLTVNGGSLSLTINDSHGGTIGTGGNITLNTGANLTINGGGALSLSVLNSDGGHIGTGGNISVTTGGNLTAGSIDALIDSSGGTIGGSANLAFNLSGQLVTQSDTSFTINNSNGGMIGVDAAVNVSAASISTGGAFNADIDNHSGGNIVGTANINYNLTGDLTTAGDASLLILNDPGTIGSHAMINVTANNVSTGSLNAAIDNSSGGMIGGMAILFFNLSGDLTTTSGDASFRIDNANRNGISGGSINGDAIINIGVGGNISAQGSGLFEISNESSGNGGGTIFSNAIINVNAANISTGGPLSATINNSNNAMIGADAGVNVIADSISTGGALNAAISNGFGTIDGSANLNFNLTGDLTTGGDAAFQIDNSSGGVSGTIGSNATVSVTANNISTDGNLGFTIANEFASHIGGSASIVLNLAGDLTTQGNATLAISDLATGTIGSDAVINVTANNVSIGGALSANIINLGGATIGGNATVNVSAASISTVGTLNAAIGNDTGTIDGSANLNFNLTGDLTTGGDAAFQIDNSSTAGGRVIGSNATVNVTANNVSTGGTLSAAIDNSAGATIGGMAILFFDLSGALTTTGGDASFRIDNANRNGGIGGGSINGDAIIAIGLGGDISAQGTGLFEISNDDGGFGNGGGTIGSNAIINVNAANISTGGILNTRIDNSSGGMIGGSANLTLNTGANLTVNGGGALSLSVLNNDGGHIGTGGNISVTTGGNLTAGSLDALIDNRNGGTIDSSANLTFNLSGQLVTQSGTSFTINNSNGGMIGADAAMNVSAASISTVLIGSALIATIDNSGGGTIGGNATIDITAANIPANLVIALIDNFNVGSSIGSGANVTLNVGGDLTTQFGSAFDIRNLGGIGSNATVNVTANNISTGFTLNAVIDNISGGTIGGSANLAFNLSGQLATESDTNFTINNFDGGNIGADAAINVSAASISAGDVLFANILNDQGGNIVGSANIVFNLTGDLTTQNDANFLIDNHGGGTIGGNTAINVNAADITANSLLAQINNTSGNIGGNANINFNLTGDLQTVGNASLSILNGGGTIGGDSSINVNAARISIGGSLSSTTDVTADAANGGNITFATGGSFRASGVVVETTVEPGITLTNGANITFDIGAGLTVNGGSLSLTINDSNGGTVGTGGNITLNTGANLTINGGGALTLSVLNNNGGHIGTGGNISVTTGGNLTAGSIDALIDNSGGTIDGSANIAFNFSGQLATQSDTNFTINNFNGGMIGVDAALNVSATSISTGGSLSADLLNNQVGNIVGSANIVFNLAGDLTTQNDAIFVILNDFGGTIGSDAVINVTANNVSTGTLDAVIDNSSGGTIGGIANIFFDLSGDLTTTSGDASFRINNANGNGISAGSINGDAIINIGVGGDISAQGTGLFEISNDDGGSVTGGGTIGSNAMISVGAGNISTGGPLTATIENSGGTIVGGANINFNLTGNLMTLGGDAVFQILNYDNGFGSGPGTIGSNATVNVTANNVSTGGTLTAAVDNSNSGNIGGNALLSFNLTGALQAQGNAFFGILNHDNSLFGGTITGNATVNVTAANITANSLTAQINNDDGTIGGNAAINMNVSSAATITNNATFQIRGSDTAAAAAINFNGGSYDAGGTFLSLIDGNGTITFNNASAHADVLKAGVFGANGALNINGGMLSADTTLKLYAPGSSGQLNFMSNVTLGGNSLKILAANSVTIFNGVIVTIAVGGPAADVYTNNANYTGFGGNGTRTGTFAGAGANNPQPLASAPPFGPASPATVRTGRNITTRTRIPLYPPSPVTIGGKVPVGGTVTSGKKIDNVINVRSSDELLSLLDGADPGPGGKITIPGSKITNNSKNSNRIDPAGRLNPVSRSNIDRRSMGTRTASSLPVGRLPQ